MVCTKVNLEVKEDEGDVLVEHKLPMINPLNLFVDFIDISYGERNV